MVPERGREGGTDGQMDRGRGRRSGGREEEWIEGRGSYDCHAIASVSDMPHPITVTREHLDLSTLSSGTRAVLGEGGGREEGGRGEGRREGGREGGGGREGRREGGMEGEGGREGGGGREGRRGREGGKEGGRREEGGRYCATRNFKALNFHLLH